MIKMYFLMCVSSFDSKKSRIGRFFIINKSYFFFQLILGQKLKSGSSTIKVDKGNNRLKTEIDVKCCL